MKKNEATNVPKIVVHTSSMMTVRCALLNRARAVVHELDEEVCAGFVRCATPALFHAPL